MQNFDDIVKVVEYYNLMPTHHISDKFKIPCPFHAEDTASCYIDADRNTYFCFGCGERGDTLSFIRKVENINSLQAMMIYRKIQQGSKNSNVIIRKTPPVNIKQALKEAKIYFYSISKPSWRYIKYNYMYERGFSESTLIEHDVKINPEDSYRIICPIKDCGRFRGYVKRRTDGNDKECKYLYNKGFRRKLIVMGDYDLGGWIPITEGYMDWLKLKQYGCENAAAIFGWEAMPKQIAKIKEHTNYIISALDNTPTGEEGTKLLKKHFHVVRFQFPENCKDVGELTGIQFKKAWNDTLRVIQKYENKLKKTKGVS